jgi:hypothetical protein
VQNCGVRTRVHEELPECGAPGEGPNPFPSYFSSFLIQHLAPLDDLMRDTVLAVRGTKNDLSTRRCPPLMLNRPPAPAVR